MKSDLHSHNVAAPVASNMTDEDWRAFEQDCKAAMELGGERGKIAARMLDIGARLRALASKAEAAVERYCS